MSAPMHNMAAYLRDSKDPTAQALSRSERRGLPEEWISALYDWAGYTRLVLNLSTNTAANYVRWAGRWMEYLHTSEMGLEQAKPDNMIAWQRELALKDQIAASTGALALYAVRQFYNWRELNGQHGNPTANVKAPKKPKRQPRKFSADQLSRLFAAPDLNTPIGVRDFAILLFIYAIGARREELANLDMQQLVLKKQTGAVRFHGKGNKERTLTFEGPVVDAMWNWLAVRESVGVKDVDAVFVSFRGKRKGHRITPNGANDLMNRLCKKAGIKKHPTDPFGVHRLRSSFATDLYDQGKDIRTIQLLLGHDDINTTMLYIAITDRHMHERMPSARLNELLGNKPKVPGYVEEKLRSKQPD